MLHTNWYNVMIVNPRLACEPYWSVPIAVIYNVDGVTYVVSSVYACYMCGDEATQVLAHRAAHVLHERASSDLTDIRPPGLPDCVAFSGRKAIWAGAADKHAWVADILPGESDVPLR